MNVTIDSNSGFCFGVVSAIKRAEQELEVNEELYCLGEIVHNNLEVERLKKQGLRVISSEEFSKLKNNKVLIRAHGEPPATYEFSKQQNIELIDSTCPIVLQLQNKVKQGYEEMCEKGGQVLIFGTKGHAEVVGLEGHAKGTALVLSSLDEICKIDFKKPIRLFSQTTKNKEDYNTLIEEIKKRLGEDIDFVHYNTICGQVANRSKEIQEFAKSMDIVIFISGKNSSNGKYLYGICLKAQPNTHFVSDISELNPDWFFNVENVGIAGATSTPMWLMEELKETILNHFGKA